MLWKCWTQHASKFGKLKSDHRSENGQFSFQSQRKCQQIWTAQKWPQVWKWSVFIPIPKKGNAKECLNYCTIALIWQASKITFKIFQATLQQYELGTFRYSSWMYKRQRKEISNCKHPLDHRKSKTIPEKHLLCFIDYVKVFVWITTNWKILKEMRIPDQLT